MVRSGSYVSITVVLSSLDGRPFRILDQLSDHNPDLSARSRFSVDGLRLVDPDAKLAYLPAATVDGGCLCTPAADDWTDRYTVLTATVMFAAPPADRDRIDVILPGFGTLARVPVR